MNNDEKEDEAGDNADNNDEDYEYKNKNEENDDQQPQLHNRQNRGNWYEQTFWFNVCMDLGSCTHSSTVLLKNFEQMS